MIFRIILFYCLMVACLASKAQDEWDVFLQAGVDDAGQMLQSYMQPIYRGVGYGYTNGWYHTAKAHESLGFDISVSANFAFIPKDELTYTFNNSDYTNIQLSNAPSDELPTVFGPYLKNERPELTFYNEGEEVIRATSPPGAIDLKKEIGFNALPVPMVQAGVGIIRETDIIVRFIPTINFSENAGKVNMFGLGIKHNLGQWIKFLDYSGVDVSLMTGFSQLNLHVDLSEEDDPATIDNKGEFNLNGFVLQGIISKEYINIFTIYGGIGFSRARSRTQILGNYPIDEEFDQLPEDPIDLIYRDGSMNLTAGLRVRLVALTLSTAYTFQDYPVLSFGVGVSVR